MIAKNFTFWKIFEILIYKKAVAEQLSDWEPKSNNFNSATVIDWYELTFLKLYIVLLCHRFGIIIDTNLPRWTWLCIDDNSATSVFTSFAILEGKVSLLNSLGSISSFHYRFSLKNTIDSDLELGKNHFILLSKPCDLLKKLSKNSIRFDVLTSLIKKHYEENSPTFSIEEQHSSEIWFKMWNFSISLRRRKETKWMVKVKVPWT